MFYLTGRSVCPFPLVWGEQETNREQPHQVNENITSTLTEYRITESDPTRRVDRRSLWTNMVSHWIDFIYVITAPLHCLYLILSPTRALNGSSIRWG